VELPSQLNEHWLQTPELLQKYACHVTEGSPLPMELVKKIEAAQAASADKHDAYTTAHLSQCKDRITKALDADYILNPSRGGSSGGGLRIIFGKEKAEQAP
jgi:hypothetical protein